ncbi:MAG: PDZ domain-containing protein [Clostridiales bacterium]|jgi:serine protease Do|nr:PDZ domain-containing protein [Clostridiales bacterium]
MFDRNDNMFNNNTDSITNQTSEVSYAPIDENNSMGKIKMKKRLKGFFKAVGALVLVATISTTSIIGYKWFEENEPLEKVEKIFTFGYSDKEKDKSKDSEDSDKSSGSESSGADNSIQIKDWVELASRKNALTIPEIVEKVMPSVVGVSSTRVNGTSTGTGIIMTEDGYIITNCHVVEDSKEIMIVLENEEQYKAKLIGSDYQTDLAVLKIDADGLTAAEFGDSDDLVVGELAVAIGNPLGFELFGSVTSGIISALDREITIDDKNMKLIQTNAAMNSGNSGGPLINSYGQVIGINSVKITSSYYTSVEGLGFAIPITEAKIIINDLINVGYVTGRPSLGIFCQEIDAMTARFNNLPQGIYVVSVNEGGAGDKAGIKAEDVIIGIQGQPITTYTEFNAIKNQYKVGDKITITVSRKNRDIDLEVVLEEASR